MAGTGKYDPLRRYLEASGTLEVQVTMSELAAMIEGGLPKGLNEGHSRSWANPGVTSSVQAKAWIAAGYRVRKVEADRVMFEGSP